MQIDQKSDHKKEEVKPRLLITLVHGTFAGNAKWVFDEGSVLRTAISKEFGDKVECETFKWGTLNNAHHHRLNAGAELAIQHNEFVKNNPECPSFIIAHSHGGNVAMYALRDLEQIPAGIVTMGTPFITCEPRNIKASESMLKAVAASAAYGFAFFISLLAFLLFDNFVFRHLSGGWIIVSLLIGFYLVILPIYAGAMMIENFPRLLEWAGRKQAESIQRLKLPNTTVPMLSIHVAGDEAGFWLRITRAAGDVPYRFWKMRFGALAFILLIILQCSFYWSMPFSVNSVKDAVWVIFLPVMMAAINMIWLASLWQVIMVGLPKIARALPHAFGGESLLDNWLTRIGTSVMPVEAPNSTERKYSPRRKRFWGVPLPDLLHSWMYNDKESVDEMVEWLRSRLQKPGTET